MVAEVVTSENRADYMAEKLGLKERAKKAYEESHQKAKKHPKFAALKAKLGKRGAIDAILHEMNMGDSETSVGK